MHNKHQEAHKTVIKNATQKSPEPSWLPKDPLHMGAPTLRGLADTLNVGVPTLRGPRERADPSKPQSLNPASNVGKCVGGLPLSKFPLPSSTSTRNPPLNKFSSSKQIPCSKGNKTTTWISISQENGP